MTGDHDDLALRGDPFEAFQYLAAIHPGHPDIEKGDIRHLLLEDSNRVFSAPRRGNPEAFILQDACDRFHNSFLIIYDEDFFIHETSLSGHPPWIFLTITLPKIQPFVGE